MLSSIGEERVCVYLHPLAQLHAEDRGRATVIGNENVYTNSDFRGGIESHQTNWTYLLPGSE